jgi:cytochrome c553
MEKQTMTGFELARYSAAAKRLWITLALLCGAAFAAPAAVAEGSAERGEVLSYTCLGCHGINGYRNAYPSYRVPRLGGQHPEYLVIALKAYRSGERSHPTMMANANTLSDQDMEDIAAYFASFGETMTGDVVTDDVEAGKEKSAACVACHQESGRSENPIWPVIAGQYEDYLVNALVQYRLANKEEQEAYNVRKNAIMAGLAGTLSDEDIRDLAAYFAAQKGLFNTLVD